MAGAPAAVRVDGVRAARVRPAGGGRLPGPVADDLAAVYLALGESRQEAARIKEALRAWQSEEARRLVNAGRFH